MAVINVLCLANHERLGGGEKSFSELVKGLDRQVFRPVVIGPQAGLFRETMETTGLKYYPLPLGESAKIGIIGLYNIVRAIREIVKAEQITLLYACTIKSLLLGRLGTCGKSIPAIWHVRTMKTHGMLDWLIPVLAARIITISEAVKGKIPNFYKKRTTVLPNAINLAEAGQKSIEFDFRKRYNISSDTILFGVIGRIAQEKGQSYFIEAAARIAPEYPKARFILAGEPFLAEDNKYQAHLKDLAQSLGIADKLIWPGYAPNIWPVIGALDIVVVPSLREGFGRILVEAMAMGKPIIASRIGGIPEIVQDRQEALLVTAGDSALLAQAMREILADANLRQALAQNGKKTAQSKFGLELYHDKIHKIFQESLSKY